MSDAREPLGPEEHVLRRIHKNQANPGQVLAILPAGFRPGKADVDGLSVFREKLVSPTEVASAGRKPGDYYVVRLSVQALNTLGLSAVADVKPNGPPGHALIPELAFTAYEQDKERLKAVLVELARLGSQAIVHQPAE